MTKSNLSYIEVEEEEKAKELIKEYLGFEAPRTCGWYIGVVLYIPDKLVNADGTESVLLKAEAHGMLDKFKSCVGLCVYQGSDAYKGDRFQHSGPWCKVGDWVVIPRAEGRQVNYRGRSMHLLPDDKILMVVEDPKYVTLD